MRRYALALVSVALAGACEKAETSKTAEARPASIVADITRSSVNATDGVRKFASAINPLLAMGLDDGTILQSLRQFTGLRTLDGIDRDAPIHVLIVDAPDARGVAVLAKVKDAKLLDSGKGAATLETHDGWVVFGRKAVVHEAATYAFSLVGAPTSAKPTATMYLSQLATTHAADFAAVRDRLRAKGDPKLANLADAYLDGVLAFAIDTQELRVTLDASADELALDLALIPRSGSKLATFVAAQAPSDFAMLDKLPQGQAPLMVAGHMALGPYHDGFVAVLAQMYGAPGTELANDIGAVMKVTTGDLAFTLQLSGAGMEMMQIAGLSDATVADTELAQIQTAVANGQSIALGGTKVTYRAVPGTTDHDGVKLRGFDAIYDATSPTSAAMVSRLTPSGNMHAEIAAFDHFSSTRPARTRSLSSRT